MSFNGVEHRLEPSGQINGVEFVNDSKSTNIDSTIKAINAYPNRIFLILGGRDKNLDFCDLFAKMPVRVKKIALIGEAAEKIAQSAQRKGLQKILLLQRTGGSGENTICRSILGRCDFAFSRVRQLRRLRKLRRAWRALKKIVEKMKNEIGLIRAVSPITYSWPQLLRSRLLGCCLFTARAIIWRKEIFPTNFIISQSRR